MGKTRLEELFSELYSSSKQHDPWQRHAMILELRNLLKQPLSMKMKGNRSDSMVNKIGIPEDQVLDDEELVETEVATELNGIEDRAVENEANTKMISAKVKEESIPQSKVSIPQSNSEILKSSEPEKVDLGLEKLEHVVMNEVDGDVERGQEVMSNTKICSAHQLFDQKPNKEKHMKHLKAWKFKFKPTSKRSRLMGSKFSFVDAAVLLNKDSLETIWDCVKKEFEETMAACEKNIVDRFKLAEEKESRLQVLDLNQTFMYHQIGHGVDILLAFKMLDHDKEMIVILQRLTCLTIRDCSDRSSRANRVWKPGGLVCVQDHSGGSILMIKQQFQGLHLQGIIYMDVKFQEVIVVNVETGSKEHPHERFGSKGLAYDGCVILGMNFAGFERGEAELFATSQKMQRIDLFSFCYSCTNQIFVALHTEIEENLEFNQLLAAVERFSREVIEELAKRIVIEQKIEGGLICGDVKFHLKHKWRFRFFQSFSRLVLLALINPWLSKTHAFSGQLQDLRRGEAESFLLLNFTAEPPFLWMENKSEPVLTASAFERRKKKLCSKTWMFKYKVPHLDEKIFETSDQCIRKRGLVSADQETEDNQLILRSFMWGIQNCRDQYMVLLIASVAYDAQFSVGVGMNKKQLRLSLRNNRVWDPGGSLVDAATPCLLSLHFTALHFIAAILSF